MAATSCNLPFPEFEHRREDGIPTCESTPGLRTALLWKKSGSLPGDTASTCASDDASSMEDFGCSPSPRCCWAPSFLVGSTPSPQLVALSVWPGPTLDISFGSVRPQRSAGRVARPPFQALDLPEWAQMTQRELDELSESDFEGASDDEHLADDSEEVEFSELTAEHVADDLLTKRSIGFEASTRCGSSVCVLAPRPQSLSEVSTFQRWADLLDSEDDEVLVSATASMTASTLRWADLAEADDGYEQSRPAYISRRSASQPSRWADLVDSDDDTQ